MTLQRHRSLMLPPRKASSSSTTVIMPPSFPNNATSNHDNMTGRGKGGLRRQGSLPAKFHLQTQIQYLDITPKIMGYDVAGGSTSSPGPPLPSATMLSSRRELVEQLESEPLFDYLVQNGVLESQTADSIRAEKSDAKTNLALLRHLEGSGPAALSLLVNALRQTGQHSLANLLDDSGRIRALSGSGYLSSKRHRGQVSLCIQVKALRLPHDETGEKHPMSSFREWVSLDDLMHRITDLSNPVPTFHPSYQTIDPSDLKDPSGKKERSCICHCFTRLFSRRKGSDKKKQTAATATNMSSISQSQVEVTINTNGFPKNSVETKINNQVKSISSSMPSSSSVTTASSRETLENLRNLADTFREKSQALYGALRETSSLAYTQLLKYFEQDRGVLVLDTDCDDGIVVVNICMKLEQLEQLRRDYGNGKLTKDLENVIVTEEILSTIGARGVKLKAGIDQEEFEQAEQELA